MGQPKALLTLNGETLLERVARTLGAIAEPVIVVTGAYPGLLSPIPAVHNPDWEQGQLTSLQAGLRALNPRAPGYVFTPVDCALFEGATLDRMWQLFLLHRPLFVIPRQGGRRGHPVLFHASLRDRFLALPPTGEARQIVHAHREQTIYADVDDPGIHADLDTPEDYRHALESLRP
jgi:molybdenum cofactor cytidylyltransferase